MVFNRCTDINRNKCAYNIYFLALPTERPRGNDTSTAMRTTISKILDSKHHSPRKGTVFLEEIADSRAGAGKESDELGTS